LGDLLDRARAVEAVKEALKRGEFGESGKLATGSKRLRRLAEVDDTRGGEVRAIGFGEGSSNGRLVAVEDVAAMPPLKASTGRAYAERGSLPCVRAGNRLRFRPSDVDLWIEQRRSKGGS